MLRIFLKLPPRRQPTPSLYELKFVTKDLYISYLNGRSPPPHGIWWLKHIAVETNWPPFCRQRFQVYFVNEGIGVSVKISLTIVLMSRINNHPSSLRIVQTRVLFTDSCNYKWHSNSIVSQNSTAHVLFSRPFSNLAHAFQNKIVAEIVTVSCNLIEYDHNGHKRIICILAWYCLFAGFQSL